MKILLLARNFWPELTGIGFYEADLADWLHDRGHLVSVVTTPPHYPGWKIDAAEYTRFWRRDHRKPYPILRCPLYVPKRLTAATRLAHSASFGLSGLPAVFAEAARFRPDIVGAVMPTLAAAPAALAAGVAFRARSWLHVQDLEVDAAVGLGMLGGAPSRMALRFERAMLRRFDCITTITPAMRARLVEKRLGDRDPLVIPNWIDTARIHPRSGAASSRDFWGLPAGVTVALYSGSLVAKQGLELIVDTARLLADRHDILFLICGAGPLKDSLMAAARDLGHVRFLPLQPADRLNDLLNAADIHLLPQAAAASDLVMPSKLGPMLASGRPVVASVDAGSAVAQTIGSAGLVVPPNDADAFAGAILTLAAAPESRSAMGRIGRDTALREFDRETILPRLEGALLALTSRADLARAAS